MSIAVLPELAAAPTRRVSWALLRRPAPLISLIFFVLLIGAVLLVPWLGLPDPLAQDLSHVMQMPSGGHVLGTDTLGRDIFSRLLWGGRPALWGALEATAVFATVGIVLGLAAGYSHGATDRFISGAVDVMGSLPSIVVVFAVLSLFGNDLSAAMIAAGFFGSYGLIRIVRAATQETREELFVAAAKVSGIGPLRILARHVLPRLVNPIVVQLTIYFGLALVLQSGLGFLNLGVPAPKPSWGGMVGEGATVVQQFPWLLVPPGVTIALTVLATVLLGETLQEMTGRNASRVRLSRHHRTTISRTAESTTSTASTADALLEVRGLTVALPTPNGAKTVVRQITFSVSPGELVGLVGESGSGKTITALSLLGLLPEGSTVTAAALRFD
ncbi:MAG: ABC transporter permease subunit, partial [Leifsonia sp.]